jgi:hypothetical protein
MLEWILVIFSVLGMANQFRQTHLTNPTHGVKYLYLHPNGYYYDFPPQIREYQNQNQETVGTPYWTQGGSTGYYNGQSPQTFTYPQGY